jgi:hypothetical protein
VDISRLATVLEVVGAVLAHEGILEDRGSRSRDARVDA